MSLPLWRLLITSSHWKTWYQPNKRWSPVKRLWIVWTALIPSFMPVSIVYQQIITRFQLVILISVIVFLTWEFPGLQAKAEYVPYYKNALLFLSCVDIKDLSAAERLERAYDLSIAALLGETIYNFGELVSPPPVKCLFTAYLPICTVDASNPGVFEANTAWMARQFAFRFQCRRFGEIRCAEHEFQQAGTSIPSCLSLLDIF